MKIFKMIALFLSVLTLVACSQSKLNKKTSTVNRSRPSDGEGAYVTKQYRNLFRENGHTDGEVNAKIEGAYNQLFHGDSARQRIYFPFQSNENGASAYMLDVFNNDIRSEGMSYGMMIAVQLDKKEVFNALWNFAATKMYISDTAHPSAGYFAWSLKRDGTPNSETPAPDGEEYFVMALYFASARWGNNAGIYHYRNWADKILHSIRHHPLKTGPTKRGRPVTVGPMVNEERKMIVFVPTPPGNTYTDPSYHLPHFYELWSRWGPKEDRSFWAAAADTSRGFFQRTTHPLTGLAPDYAHFNGEPVITTFNENSKNFAYDSWRTAMNWSVDWSWWRKDKNQPLLSDRIQAFFASKGIPVYPSVYSIDGKALNRSHAAGLVAANATVSLAATHKLSVYFVEELWRLPVPSSPGDRYYGGLLYLMNLLHCSGNFKIHDPGITN